MQTIETLAVKLVGDVGDFQQKMASAAQSVAAVGAKMQEVGAGMQAAGAKWSLFVTAPLVAMGKAAFSSAADFEVSMNIIEQVTSATTDQMKAMSDQALKLGKDTVFSANEAAQAQLELAKAGFKVNQVIDAMPGVLDLAAAGDVALGQAAKITAGALNAFGLQANESTRVANLLAAAANASAADIQDLALGFAQGGFAFSAANQKVDDLAASLAILTNVGLKGTDAGTALKNMFTQLYGPTAKAKEVMEKYNINIFDATGTMKPLVEIIDIFNDRLGGLSQQQRLAALDQILMSDGMKAMIPLMQAGSDGFLAMKEAVNAQGAATAVADARMKGLSGAIEYARGTLNTLMIQSATPWLDMLSQMIRNTVDWIAKFGELDPAIQKTVVTLVALAAAVGPVLIYSGMLVSAIGSITQALAGMTAFLLANPIVALAALAAALVAFAVAWDNDWMGIRDKTQVAVEYVQGLFDRMVAYVQANLPDWMAKLAEWGAAAYQWVVDSTPVALAKLGEWTVALIGWVAAKLPDWIATLLKWATAAVAWIGDSLPKAIAAFGDWIESIIRWGGSTGESQITGMGGSLANALIRGLVDNLIPKTGPELWNFAKELVRTLGEIQIAIGNAAIDIGVAVVQGIINGIKNGWNALVEAAKSAAQGALDAAKSALGISSPSREGLAVGQNFAQSIGMGARSALGNLQLDVTAGLRGALADIEPRYAAVGNAATQPGPVTISMSFVVGSGADAGMVAGAARGGTLAALRQVGYA